MLRAEASAFPPSQKKRATNKKIIIIPKIAPLYSHRPYFGHFVISPKERITAKANISIINVTISQSYTFSLTYSVFP